MENFENLGTYNGDTEHDMWVDFDRYEYTGDTTGDFPEEDLDDYINLLDDWN